MSAVFPKSLLFQSHHYFSFCPLSLSIIIQYNDYAVADQSYTKKS